MPSLFLRQYLPKILIVDDQATNVLLLNEAVSGLAETFFASDGAGALELFATVKPDLVLLDIEMPGLNGFETFDRMKQIRSSCGFSVIFVTSHSPKNYELTSLEMGGVDFLQKPLDLPVAKARISLHLDLRLRSSQLAHAQRNLVDVVKNLPCFISQWNGELQNVLSNDAEGLWFGKTSQAMNGMHLSEVLGQQLFSQLLPAIEDVVAGLDSSFDIQFSGAGDTVRFGQAHLIHREAVDFEKSFILLIWDMTERRSAELALHDEKERLTTTLNSIGDAVIATDTRGFITYLNPIAESLTGWMASEAINKPIELVMELCTSGEMRPLQNPIRIALKEERTVGMALDALLIRRNGQAIPVEDSASPIRTNNGAISGSVIVFHDVSEARAMAVKMSHLANHDALTDLPNRLLLRDRIDQALRGARVDNAKAALLVIDIDNFKTINDTLGHSIGDALLVQTARRLLHAVDTRNTVSRHSGDEFILLIPNVTEIQQVASIGAKIQDCFEAPFVADGKQLNLSCTIGVSIFPDDAVDAEAFYRHAESAMYAGKQDRNSKLNFFSAEIEHRVMARHYLFQDLKQAIQQQEFQVYFQPKYDVRRKQIVGAEALLRWQRPNGGFISPADFIPLAEESGLIVPLGLFVVRETCGLIKRLAEERASIRIAINVSNVQLKHPRFVESIREILMQESVSGDQLEIELTESVFAEDVEQTLAVLNRLRQEGIKLAIDDFGTGYSSLSYLKKFPLNVLKVDQSFVRDMLNNGSDRTLVETIVQMANCLGLDLVAEGVETEAQAILLERMGCTTMQGYLFGKPVEKKVFKALLIPPSDD